ncbi:hypothetical protein F4777DRAFT_503569 [Nemania sp. FL0916]|nr:hypothetical protein F4777DRAFT_503569 [Nemania sp. FL0916]
MCASDAWTSLVYEQQAMLVLYAVVCLLCPPKSSNFSFLLLFFMLLICPFAQIVPTCRATPSAAQACPTQQTGRPSRLKIMLVVCKLQSATRNPMKQREGCQMRRWDVVFFLMGRAPE